MNYSSSVIPENISLFSIPMSIVIKLTVAYFLIYVYRFTRLSRYEISFDPSSPPYGLYSFLSESDTSDEDDEDTSDEGTSDEEDSDTENDEEEAPNPTRKPVYTLSNYGEKFADEYKKAVVKILTPEELNRLSCNFVVEQTPLGNVFMCYHYHENDQALNAFHYYSDSTIPYGFLEVVAKKYVISFDCKMVYVDIQTEIENTKKKQEEANTKKKQEEVHASQHSTRPPTKPNVFAKFKEYNRDTMSHSKELLQPKVSHQANATSSSMTTKQTAEKKGNPAFVKEQINKYVFKGRVQNFGFLKKVDRKLVDKKYGMTFAEFKLLQLNKDA